VRSDWLPTSARKAARVIAQHLTADVARTVAARGAEYISASSPKDWPGPRLATRLPPTRTSQAPLSMT
jgi:hypothetical protein